MRRDFDEDDDEAGSRGELPKRRLDLTDIKVEALDLESNAQGAEISMRADGLNIPDYINKGHYLTPEGLEKLEEEDLEDQDAPPFVEAVEFDDPELNRNIRRLSQKTSNIRHSSGVGSFVN